MLLSLLAHNNSAHRPSTTQSIQSGTTGVRYGKFVIQFVFFCLFVAIYIEMIKLMQKRNKIELVIMFDSCQRLSLSKPWVPFTFMCEHFLYRIQFVICAIKKFPVFTYFLTFFIILLDFFVLLFLCSFSFEYYFLLLLGCFFIKPFFLLFLITNYTIFFILLCNMLKIDIFT